MSINRFVKRYILILYLFGVGNINIILVWCRKLLTREPRMHLDLHSFYDGCSIYDLIHTRDPT